MCVVWHHRRFGHHINVCHMLSMSLKFTFPPLVAEWRGTHILMYALLIVGNFFYYFGLHYRPQIILHPQNLLQVLYY